MLDKGEAVPPRFQYWRWTGYVRFAVLVFDTRISWADCYRRMPLQRILIRSRNVWMNTYPNDAGQSPTFWRQRRIMSLCAPFTVKTGSFVTSWKRAFPLSSIIKSQWVSVVGTYNSTEISGRWQLAVGPIFQPTQSSEEFDFVEGWTGRYRGINFRHPKENEEKSSLSRRKTWEDTRFLVKSRSLWLPQFIALSLLVNNQMTTIILLMHQPIYPPRCCNQPLPQ